MGVIRANLQAVRERVAEAAGRAGRDPERVRVVAVAKTAGAEELRAAWEAGQREFGHNRVQALEAHAAVLPAARWHLIGPLQRNKVRRALRHTSLVQTVGDPRIAAALARAAPAAGRSPLEILVQVNLTPGDGRYGVPPEGLAALLEDLGGRGALTVRGLMTLGPQGAPVEVLRRHFARLRQLAEREAAAGRLPAGPELSMGMTEDFATAVEEGATMVRIGRAIFPPQDPC